MGLPGRLFCASQTVTLKIVSSAQNSLLVGFYYYYLSLIRRLGFSLFVFLLCFFLLVLIKVNAMSVITTNDAQCMLLFVYLR